jgi:hypothetical protein
MPGKSTMAKVGLKTAKKAPAKGKLAKGGFKLGKRKAERTPAGTAAFYAKVLLTNERARTNLREAIASAKKVYERSTDRRGRVSIAALLDDRKARREGQNALASLRTALQIANRNRKQPKSAKGPAIAVIVVAGTGTALAVNKDLRAKALGLFGSKSSNGNAPAAQQPATGSSA